MLSISKIYIVAILGFALIPVLQFIINPNSISEPPTSSKSMDIVDRTSAQSIALFALVLVIIQFILDGGEITQYQALTIGVLSLCAGFLMLTFILELFGGMWVIVFHLHITSLRYSGLLLFSGLYFLLLSYQLDSIIYIVLGGFVLLSWATWVIHELHYLMITQRREWNETNQHRKEWLVTKIKTNVESWRE